MIIFLSREFSRSKLDSALFLLISLWNWNLNSIISNFLWRILLLSMLHCFDVVLLFLTIVKEIIGDGKCQPKFWKEPPLQFLCLIVLSNIWVMCNRNWAVIRLQLLKLLSLASIRVDHTKYYHIEPKWVQTKCHYQNDHFWRYSFLPINFKISLILLEVWTPLRIKIITSK